MKTKETSFFRNFKKSICDFEKYPEMASKPYAVAIKYIMILLSIFTLIITTVSIYKISKELNKGISYFENEFPDVSYSDGKLQVASEETIRIETKNDAAKLIIVDTKDILEEEINAYTKEIEKYDTGLILLKDKLIINMKNGTLNYSYEDLLKNYNIQNMTKQDMLSYFKGSNLVMIYLGMCIINYIYLFIVYFANVLIDALMLAVMGYITSLLLRLRLRFSALFKVGIYSLTLPIVLNLIYILVQAFTGFTIKYFEIMYIAIAYIYVVTTILMIKSDLIKKGEELAKILEEQEKVKEELQRQEEEKRRQREKEEQERKEKKQQEKGKKKQQENKEDNEDKGIGEEPQGENA